MEITEGETHFSRRLVKLSGTGIVEEQNHRTINFPSNCFSVFGNHWRRL